MHYSLFLHALRLKMCVIKQLIVLFCIFCIPGQYKTQEMCADHSLIVYYTDICKNQRMCDEAINDCLAALKPVPDWFVTSKMIEKTVYCFVRR